ncbi:hypothetical protein HDZ31DRAFT_81803 [Schizophyllum fasciatum]
MSESAPADFKDFTESNATTVAHESSTDLPPPYPFSSMLTDPGDFATCASGVSLQSLSLADFSELRVMPISPANFSRRRNRYVPAYVLRGRVFTLLFALLIICRSRFGSTLRLQPGRVRYPLYERQSQLDHRWEAVEHPEGVLYFVWRERHIYVDTDMGDPDNAQYIHLAIAVIDKFLAAHEIAWPDGAVDLVLDLYPDQFMYADGVCGHARGECGLPDDMCQSMVNYFPGACGYYFVHHETRAVFWFDDMPAWAIPQCAWVQVAAAAHLRHAIQSQYWSHCAYFPDCRLCDRALIHELHATITHVYGDQLVYTQSIAGPWGREQLDRMMSLIGTLSDFGGAGIGCARIVFEFLAEHSNQRFVLFHGQPAVRFKADKSQYAPEELPSSLGFRIARVLLFYVTDVYIRDLDDLGRDSPLQNHEWQAFMEKAMTEWQEITLYASILLLRRHRTRAVQDNMEALSYLADQYDEETGYGLLAIFYSLPFACLMYSTIAFFSAFLLMGFKRCTVAQAGALAGLVVVAICVVIWFLSRTWRNPRRRNNNTVFTRVLLVLMKARCLESCGAGSKPLCATQAKPSRRGHA